MYRFSTTLALVATLHGTALASTGPVYTEVDPAPAGDDALIAPLLPGMALAWGIAWVACMVSVELEYGAGALEGEAGLKRVGDCAWSAIGGHLVGGCDVGSRHMVEDAVADGVQLTVEEACLLQRFLEIACESDGDSAAFHDALVAAGLAGDVDRLAGLSQELLDASNPWGMVEETSSGSIGGVTQFREYASATPWDIAYGVTPVLGEYTPGPQSMPFDGTFEEGTCDAVWMARGSTPSEPGL